jgi:hypothetical protein
LGGGVTASVSTTGGEDRRSVEKYESEPAGHSIVDDNDDNRFTLSLFLEAEGLERIR